MESSPKMHTSVLGLSWRILLFNPHHPVFWELPVLRGARYCKEKMLCGQVRFALLHYTSFLGFPGGASGKEYSCNAGDEGSIPGSGDPLEKGMATHSSILA